jgi:hypothetical protein
MQTPIAIPLQCPNSRYFAVEARGAFPGHSLNPFIIPLVSGQYVTCPGASSSAAVTLVDLKTHRGERVQAPEMEGALHVDILRARWQLSNVPPERRQLAAWPLQLPHCSLQLFRTHNDAEAVHAAAPRWHLKGDSECLMDMEVSVELLESGLQFLQSIAQIQRGLVCTRLFGCPSEHNFWFCESDIMQHFP